VIDTQIVSKSEGLDYVLDVPLRATARAWFMLGQPNGTRDPFSVRSLAETGENVLSAHVGQIGELPTVLMRPWLRLIALVPSPYGDILHGLPGGLTRILRLIDGRRSGREIYDALIRDGEDSAAYSLVRFRRHLGLLKRIGAIGFHAGESVRQLSERSTAVPAASGR
jgi:hypothetical protein